MVLIEMYIVTITLNKHLTLFTLLMPKPKGQKNTKNKAKHSKLIARKVNKQKAEKALRKERLKEIIQRAKNAGTE